MSKIKKPEAYFKRVVQNSYKDEFRANDNFFKHISSVGDEADIQLKHTEEKINLETDDNLIDSIISESSAENWLFFIENEKLFAALSILSREDIELLYILYVYGYSQREAASLYNVSHIAIGKKFRRIMRILRKFLENGK